MTQKNSFLSQPIQWGIVTRYMLIGSGIALVLILTFLWSAGEPDPAWGPLWRLRPLIIVPLAGAAGGAFYYFITQVRYRGEGWNLLAKLIGIIGYVIAFWMGTVLGLDGTYWN